MKIHYKCGCFIILQHWYLLIKLQTIFIYHFSLKQKYFLFILSDSGKEPCFVMRIFKIFLSITWGYPRVFDSQPFYCSETIVLKILMNYWGVDESLYYDPQSKTMRITYYMKLYDHEVNTEQKISIINSFIRFFICNDSWILVK